MSTPQSLPTTKLGGAASSVSVGKVAHGLMMMTWKTPVVSDEQAFAAIIAGLELVSPGEKVILNSGTHRKSPLIMVFHYSPYLQAEFYGHQPPTANLELLGRFFTKYPQYKDRAFLSVKGGMGAADMRPNSSPENLRRRSVQSSINFYYSLMAIPPQRRSLHCSTWKLRQEDRLV